MGEPKVISVADAEQIPLRGQTARALEMTIVILMLIFPVSGTLFPPEGYFAPQSYSIQDVTLSSDSVISSNTFVFAFMLIFIVYIAIYRLRSMAETAMSLWPVVLFTLYSFLNSTWATSPGIAFNRTLRMAVFLCFALYLIDRYATEIVVKMFVIAILVSSFLSFIMIFAFPSYGMNTLVSQGYVNAWRGAFGHKNSLGAWASTSLIICVFAFKSKIFPKLSIVITGILIIFLFMSESATSIIATVITALSTFYLSQFHRYANPLARVLLIVVAGVLLSTIVVGAGYFDEIIGFVGRDATLTGRQDVWAAVSIAIEHSPIYGQGQSFWISPSQSIEEIRSRLGWAVPSAHNTWLDIWLQLGAVGLAIWSIACLSAIKKVAALVMFSNRREVLLWAALLFNSLFRSLTETAIVVPGTVGIFAFGLGYAGLARLAKAEIAAKSQAPGRYRPT